MLAAFPQLSRRIIAHRRNTLLSSYFEKAVVVSFCLFFYFPQHSKLFLTASFFNLIAIQLAMPAALPRSIYGTRAGRRHPPPATCLQKATAVSFPLLFIFLSQFHFFSQHIF
jgi:hypothetical protein